MNCVSVYSVGGRLRGILSFVGGTFFKPPDATLGEFAAKNVKLFKMPGAKGGQVP